MDGDLVILGGNQGMMDVNKIKNSHILVWLLLLIVNSSLLTSCKTEEARSEKSNEIPNMALNSNSRQSGQPAPLLESKYLSPFSDDGVGLYGYLGIIKPRPFPIIPDRNLSSTHHYFGKEVVIQLQFLQAGHFFEGHAPVQTQAGTWSILDTSGKLAAVEDCDQLGTVYKFAFNCGLIPGKRGGKWAGSCRTKRQQQQHGH